MLELLLLFALSPFCLAATVTYNWDVTWVNRSPDGFERPVIGINGAWPCPPIEANVGDRVIVHLTNKLGNETTSLHFHGLYQHGSNTMDGPSGVNQCQVPPGGSITYDFTIKQPGTYWYHSHTKGQYPDGLRGPLIVHDPNAPFKGDYDEEIVLTLSDWYHDQMPGLIDYYVSTDNVEGAEPIPNGALMNDAQNIKLNIKPGRKYLVRVINIGAFAAHILHFDDHQMSVVEIDGIYTQPKDADFIYVAAAQRYSVLIQAQKTARKNYAFQSSMDIDMFDSVPDGLNPNVTGVLVYDDAKPMPGPPSIKAFKPVDDFKLTPYDKKKRLDDADKTIVLNVDFIVGNDNIQRAYFNGITYLGPVVPTLYTALSAPQSLLENPTIYGPHTNPWILKKNQIVDIVVNNHDSGGHPFHLHGHAFQVLARSKADAGDFNGKTSGFPDIPMRRDTVVVPAGGHLVLRFKADNPGVWLFHCHIEWHVEAGLTATLIEDPSGIRSSGLSIPADHSKLCVDQNIKTVGNAAGHSDDWLDLTGQNDTPKLGHHGAIIGGVSKKIRRGMSLAS